MMRLFNRISATVLSSVDNVISKVENHEAMVDAMISDIQKNAAKARVQLKRVQKDREASEKQTKELETAAERWQARAVDAAKTDESRALECLQRRKQCTSRLDSLCETLADQKAQEKKLIANQKRIEERLQEVKQQRNLMRSRESVSDAMRVLKNIEGDGCGQLDDAFDRWEISMSTSEIEGEESVLGNLYSNDSLSDEYQSQEEQEALRAELDALIGGSDLTQKESTQESTQENKSKGKNND